MDGLEGSDVRTVIAAARTRRFPAHASIYEQGQPARECFLLTQGRARYFHINPDGRKMLLHWLGPGEVLGFSALLTLPSAYRVGTETVRASSLLVWDRVTMRALLERYPRLSHNALSVAAGYLDWYVAAHAALVSDTARQRLANVLTSLGQAIGSEVAGGVELQVTNEELASAANITPFTVSRLLNEWQAASAVTKHRGKVVLHSPKRLFRLAG